MQKAIKAALGAFLSSYTQTSGIDTTGVLSELSSVFQSTQDFMSKVAAVDKVVDDHPKLEELREYIIDLLFIHFFTEDVIKLEEDYLDSPEWEAIEEKTLDRGSELLNVLLYLKECQDEDIEPELSDFLKEFLLVDEDEFQDEYRIYEPVIANQILLESSATEIAKVANGLAGDAELKELFYALLCFFRNPYPSVAEQEEILAASVVPATDLAVYQLLLNFNKPI
ncbi:MAG: hypothetical protein ACKOWL_02710 [Sphingobacteriaceae bacterium]